MVTKKKAAKKTGKKAAKTSASKAKDKSYSKPELREKIKKKVLAGSKGGRPGQWSARKAQLVTHEYEAAGGDYKRPRSSAQKSLKEWGAERWRSSDGKRAIRGGVTHRYLPDAAWKELSPAEARATDRKKVTASKRGKQFAANTPSAAKARKRAARRKS